MAPANRSFNQAAQDSPAFGALTAAVRHGEVGAVKDLLARGADPDERDEHDNPALVLAAMRGYSRIVSMLLDRGASIEAVSGVGLTPLFHAVYAGNPETAIFLINKGAAVNIKDVNDYTVLIWAVMNNQEDVVRLLIEKGASDEKNRHGSTALSVAKERKYSRIAQMLEEAAQRRLEEAVTRRKKAFHSAVILQRDLRCRSPFKRKSQ